MKCTLGSVRGFEVLGDDLVGVRAGGVSGRASGGVCTGGTSGEVRAGGVSGGVSGGGRAGGASGGVRAGSGVRAGRTTDGVRTSEVFRVKIDGVLGIVRILGGFFGRDLN